MDKTQLLKSNSEEFNDYLTRASSFKLIIKRPFSVWVKPTSKFSQNYINPNISFIAISEQMQRLQISSSPRAHCQALMKYVHQQPASSF